MHLCRAGRGDVDGAETCVCVRTGGAGQEPGNASATKTTSVVTESLSDMLPLYKQQVHPACLLGLISQSRIKPQVFPLIGETLSPNTELFPFRSV